MEERHIKVRIGEIEYELRSRSEEQESLIREAARSLNDMISSYQGRYPSKDKVDILSFVSINQCMNNIRLQRELNATARGLAEFGREIDEYLGTTEI